MKAVLEVYNNLKPHELIKPGPRNPSKEIGVVIETLGK